MTTTGAELNHLLPLMDYPTATAPNTGLSRKRKEYDKPA